MWYSEITVYIKMNLFTERFKSKFYKREITFRCKQTQIIQKYWSDTLCQSFFLPCRLNFEF